MFITFLTWNILLKYSKKIIILIPPTTLFPPLSMSNLHRPTHLSLFHLFPTFIYEQFPLSNSTNQWAISTFIYSSLHRKSTNQWAMNNATLRLSPFVQLTSCSNLLHSPFPIYPLHPSSIVINFSISPINHAFQGSVWRFKFIMLDVLL